VARRSTRDPLEGTNSNAVTAALLMEILRWSALGLVWICGVASGIAMNAAYWAMVDKVNAKLPKDQQFSHPGWWFGKYQRLHREYRRLFPSGDLLRKAGIYSLLAFLCLSLATALLGFPWLGVAFFIVVGGLVNWVTYFRASP
jgi:4-hydroxybenzoate polyprenyltransferase